VREEVRAALADVLAASKAHPEPPQARSAFLSPKDAADRSGRHRPTITRALVNGDLHGTQHVPRGRWSIRSSCLEAWMGNAKCEHQNVTLITRP
jgi:hypothetical protein